MTAQSSPLISVVESRWCVPPYAYGVGFGSSGKLCMQSFESVLLDYLGRSVVFRAAATDFFSD